MYLLSTNRIVIELDSSKSDEMPGIKELVTRVRRDDERNASISPPNNEEASGTATLTYVLLRVPDGLVPVQVVCQQEGGLLQAQQEVRGRGAVLARPQVAPGHALAPQQVGPRGERRLHLGEKEEEIKSISDLLIANFRKCIVLLRNRKSSFTVRNNNNTLQKNTTHQLRDERLPLFALGEVGHVPSHALTQRADQARRGRHVAAVQRAVLGEEFVYHKHGYYI